MDVVFFVKNIKFRNVNQVLGHQKEGMESFIKYWLQ